MGEIIIVWLSFTTGSFLTMFAVWLFDKKRHNNG
jgi:hypothetical protein